MNIPFKIIYGCIVGRFAQRVATLIAGKRGTVHGDDKQLVGMFAVYADKKSIERDQYLLIGTTEYERIIQTQPPMSIYDALREANYLDGARTSRWAFSRVLLLSQRDYPVNYGSISSDFAAGPFMDRRTQYAVIKEFKEFLK